MKALLIGPLPSPITGQSLVNNVILKEYPKRTDNSIDYINTANSELEEENGRFNFSKVILYLKSYKKAFQIKNHEVIYLTIGQTFWGILRFLPFFILAKLYKKNIVIHVHGNHLWKEYADLRGTKKEIFRTILSWSNRGIVLSESLRKNLTPFISSERIFILNNFVEQYIFPEQDNKDCTSLKIIYLSNLLEDKGIYDFLQGLIELKNNGINFKAKIAGAITAVNKKTTMDLLCEIGDDAEYLGIVQGGTKKNLLDWGNTFVLPSKLEEGQPMSILEAMATGNVILPTKVGGIPDIFKERVNGFYIEKSSSASIYKRLEWLSLNCNVIEEISINNMKEAKSKYKLERFINELDHIFTF